MKKLLILALSVILLLSVFTISACGKETAGTSSSFFRSIEESATKTKKSRNPNAGLPSQSINNSTTPTPSGAPGQSQSAPSSDAPVVPVGDTFYVKQASESDPSVTSTNAKLAIMQINFIESVSPSNFREKIELIDAAYELYNTLTAGEKSQVLNYSSLEGAKAHYLKLQAAAVVIEFEELVGRTIPDVSVLKNADVDNVYKAKDMLEQNKTAIQAMPNFNELNTKLTACYDKVVASIVESTYIAQDGNGNGILEANVTDKKGKPRSELTSPKKRGTDFASVSNFFGISDNIKGGSDDCYHTYKDKKNPNGAKIWQYHQFDGSMSFNVPTPGTLKIYVRPQNSRTYVVSQNGTKLLSQASGDTEASCLFTVDVTSGNVTLGTESGSAYIVALNFSYPNLG